LLKGAAAGLAGLAAAELAGTMRATPAAAAQNDTSFNAGGGTGSAFQVLPDGNCGVFCAASNYDYGLDARLGGAGNLTSPPNKAGVIASGGQAGVQAFGGTYGVDAIGDSAGINASTTNGDNYAVNATSTTGYGVYAKSAQGTGIYGYGGSYGVWGESPTSTSHGVHGTSVSGFGVHGDSDNNTGVSGVGGTYGVWGLSGSGFGVHGDSDNNTGVAGVGGTYGVWGKNVTTGIGVYGECPNNIGVYGLSTTNTGVSGQGATTGVHGTSASGTGVVGESSGGVGIRGISAGSQLTGVYGVHTANNGTGVAGRSYADGTQTTLGAGIGVWGDTGSGVGVKGTSASGSGVEGHGGYGGSFAGSIAPLHLDPGTGSGHPTSGTFQLGDVYLDAAGTLFLCTRAGTYGTSATPTWGQVHLTQPISLIAGWNLVAGPGLSTDIIAKQINAAGGSVQQLAVYSHGTYVVWVPGHSANFLVPATAGMYVLTGTPATWTPQ
jgi:hypothetical protein